jgi:hypothetical protein
MTKIDFRQHWLLITWVAFLLGISIFIGILIPKVNVLIPLIIVLIIPFCVFIVRDLANFAEYQKPSMLIPLLMVSLPFYNLFLVWQADLIWQCISLGVFMVYFLAQSSQDRRLALNRAAPLLVPMAILVFVSTFSVVFSREINKEIIIHWFEFASGIVYWLLVCLYCRSFSDVYRLMVILFICGLFQLPIYVGQALGWTSHFSGGLAKLSPDIWGGPLASAGQDVRYPGSFGDVELVAEYFGIIFLFGMGIFLMLRERIKRFTMVFALAIVVGMGIMTGTRGFLVMILLGTVIVLYGNYRHKGSQVGNPVNILVLISIVIILVLFFIPDVAITSLIEKFSFDQIFKSGNLINREILFSSWLTLLPEMPFWGFGNNIWNAINTVSPFVVQSPHSLFFSMLLIYGYIGLFAIFLLLLCSLIILIKSAFRAFYPRQFISWILLAVFVSWVADEVKIEFIRQQFYIDFIFLLFGLITCIYGLSKRENPTQVSAGT